MGVFDYISVDIDFDDIKNEAISMYTDEELIEELEERDKLHMRNKISSGEALAIDALYYSKDELYRHLCDIVGCGYHEPKVSLLEKLRLLL